MSPLLARAQLTMILLVAACGASPECKARTQAMRDKIAAIDWSAGLLDPKFPYARVPAAPGRTVPATRLGASILAIDGARVDFSGTYTGKVESLHAWLTAQAPRSGWVILRQGLDRSAPLHVVATTSTRLGTIRTVGAALRPFGVLHFGVRPEGPLPATWQPSANLEEAFEDAFRLRPSETPKNDRTRAFGRVPARGCSAAEHLVNVVGPYPDERLERVPDVFEECDCRGDMQTLAAFFARPASRTSSPSVGSTGMMSCSNSWATTPPMATWRARWQ